MRNKVSHFDTLIARLSAFEPQKTGVNSYISRCPAHKGSKKNLKVTKTCDGKILLHCFHGCGAEEILSTVGMEMVDLMPANGKTSREARQFGIDATRDQALNSIALLYLYAINNNEIRRSDLYEHLNVVMEFMARAKV